MSRVKYWLLLILALFLIVPYGLQQAHAACSDPPGPGVDYSGCDLTSKGINFNNLDLSGSNLAGATLDGLHLSNSKLIGANLTGASLQGTYFEKTNLTNAIVRNINAGFAIFQNSVLTNADFSGAILSNADFTHSDITNLNLSGADLSFSDFTNAYIHGNTFDSNTIFSGASYISADFSNSNLSGLNLSSADFTSANFTGSNLSNSNLQGSTFTNANFHLANLSGANLTGALLGGAVLTGANLSGALMACSGNPLCSTTGDTTPPVVTPPQNQLSAATDSSGAVVFYPTATATDNVGVVGQVICTPPSGSLFPVGVTTVTCSAHDAAGNIGSATFTVTVQDTTPPTITVPSPITAEATSQNGATVTYSVSATDLVSGTVPVTCTPASGTLFGLGITNVSCSTTDGKGNTGSASFTIKVQDTTPPTITAPASISTTATGALTTVTLGTPTVSDLVDSNPTVTNNAPSGGFPVGTTTVTWTATDKFAHSSSALQAVTIRDTTPPTITAPSITAEATSQNGATVTYSVSATDLVSGTVPVTCTPASGTLFGIGKTKVICNANDGKHNTATNSFTIKVQDTTPPTITAPASISTTATGALTTVTLGTPTVSDLVDSSPIVTNNAPSGGFPVGTTTVTWTATDHSGNKATALQTVTIIPKNTSGKITGGGQIQKDVNFGFEVNSPNGIGFTGELEFNDKLKKINLDSKSITGLFVDANGKQGTFDGTATVNKKSGYTFHVYVEDNGEPGTHDVFKIQIFDSNGVFYSNGGTIIISGNIQIHKSGQGSDGDHKTGHGDDNHGNTGHGDDNHGNTGHGDDNHGNTGHGDDNHSNPHN